MLRNRFCAAQFVMVAGQAETRRLSRGELVNIASQQAVQTYLAGLPKEVVETVDMAFLVKDSVLPVHKLLLVSASPILGDLLSSQASTHDQVQTVPLMDDGQDCVQDALGFMYRRMVLSIAPPRIACITEAKHLVQFGHKYGVQVLLDESDAFVHQWCKESFRTGHCPMQMTGPNGGYRPFERRQQTAMSATHDVLEWTAFAEGAGLDRTLGVCETWFVNHLWALGSYLEPHFGAQMAKLGTNMLTRIMSRVVTEYCGDRKEEVAVGY